MRGVRSVAGLYCRPRDRAGCSDGWDHPLARGPDAVHAASSPQRRELVTRDHARVSLRRISYAARSLHSTHCTHALGESSEVAHGFRKMQSRGCAATAMFHVGLIMASTRRSPCQPPCQLAMRCTRWPCADPLAGRGRPRSIRLLARRMFRFLQAMRAAPPTVLSPHFADTIVKLASDVADAPNSSVAPPTMYSTDHRRARFGRPAHGRSPWRQR